MTITDFTRRGGRRASVLAGLLIAVVLACRGSNSTPSGSDSTGSTTGGGGGLSSNNTGGGAGRAADTDSGGFFAPESGTGGPAGSSSFANSNANGSTDNGADTFSFFTQFQVDPPDEDSAGPKFVVAGDIDNDGLMDLATGWNESQPVQIHLQRRDAAGNVRFETITLAGTSPFVTLGGLKLGDLNGDGWLDVAVAVKNLGFFDSQLCVVPIQPPPDPSCDPDLGGDSCGPGCTELKPVDVFSGEIILLMNPGDAALLRNGDNWQEVEVSASFLAMRRDVPAAREVTEPEWNGYTDIEVGDIDGVNGPDLVVTYNEFVCPCDRPQHSRVDAYINPGALAAGDGTAWTRVNLEDDAPAVKDAALLDVDGDGDLDVVVTYTNSISQNVRWVGNPLVPGGAGQVVLGIPAWEHRPIGTIATGADVLSIADIDFDGHDDVLVRSAVGGSSSASDGILQWFRNPNVPQREPINPPTPTPVRFDFPWQVYTLVEFAGRVPEGIALGDLDGDGRMEAVVGVEGSIEWLKATVTGGAFGEWTENPIIRDSAPDDPNAAPDAPDTSTFINNVLVIDLDGDGFNDVVGTLDRRQGSGLSHDRLVWYRNNLGRR
ncbi:MAG TPA: VCBS repeat-containing protein [Phycisphaerae bacterium]|jgi:hypothetical protein